MDYRSLLADFPTGAQKDLLIQDVENSEEKFIGHRSIFFDAKI